MIFSGRTEECNNKGAAGEGQGVLAEPSGGTNEQVARID